MISLSISHREWLKQYGFGLVLIPFCIYFALGADSYESTGILGMLVHSLDLIFHEAGHFVFRFFGEFMMFLGGSLMQIIMPGLITWSCIKFDQKIGAQLALFWLGQNFIDVSIYAADAQERLLPLLGGLGPESHDWYNILSMLGMLEYTPLVAGVIYFLAFPFWLLMLIIPKWVW
ncbi:MAG: hypothetical protein R3284_08090 [Rubricoccaceae bacterium]|nr:hypothetical protein [Rubricoccaceae bacterium]